MKGVLLLFLFGGLKTVYAQTEEFSRVSGLVTTQNGKGMEDVQINNTTQRRYTLTNEAGVFYTGVKLGDTLKFSYVGYTEVVFVIKKENIQQGALEIVMLPFTEELEEVVVEQQTVDEVSLGIVTSKKKIWTKKERELYGASHIERWDSLIYSAGIRMPLDPLINLISGRTKRLKKELKMDVSQRNVELLYEKFYVYLTATLKMPEDKIMEFMYYLTDIDKGSQLLKMENSLAELSITELYISYKSKTELLKDN